MAYVLFFLVDQNELFSREGREGFICKGEIDIAIPLENVEATYKALKKYGVSGST